MNSAQHLRIQGLLFCAVALIVTAISGLLPRLHAQDELMVMAFLILVLGVPHGALDTVFAQNIYHVRSAKSWILFAAAYLTPAVLVIALWQVSPILFVVSFLIISVVHFSGDPSQGTPAVTRFLYGGAVAILPIFFHRVELGELFALLVGSDAANLLLSWIEFLRWPWLIGLGLMALHRITRDWLSGCEIAAVAILATLAPPLVAFTIFFCFMHSARHILRTIAAFKKRGPSRILSAALAPMLIILAFAAVVWSTLDSLPVDARIIQIVFVGLAALTIPHMGIVERVRLFGWENSDP